MNNCSALQSAVNQRQLRVAAQFWSPSRTVESVQGVAQNGSVVSTFHNAGFSGLGLVNSSWCDSFEQAVESLGEVVRRGEAAGLTSANFLQAKTVHEAETSLLLWRRSPVGPTNCEAQTARIGVLINGVNRELGNNAITVPPSILAQVNDADRRTQPPEEMSPTAKFAIIGGITVAGIIGIAVITGQVAPLLRTVKRAF